MSRARPNRLVLLLATLAIGLCEGSRAEAHRVGLSYGTYRVAADGFHAELIFAEPEVIAMLPGLDLDGDGRLSGVELERIRPRVEEQLIKRLEVRAADQRCKGRFIRAEPVENDGLSIDLSYDCPRAELYQVELMFLDDLEAGHRQLVQASGGGSPIEWVAYRGQSTLKIAGPIGGGALTTASGNGALRGMLGLGVEHILTGTDHLLFLLGLVIVGGRVRSLLGVITAFTVAHSITLGLAVLGVWAPSGSIVEPAIALSVAYVAIENWFIEDATKRWRIALAFGLLHGFGFAGALGELHVSKSDVPLALVLFNVGVELGQLLILAVALPPIFWARRRAWFRSTGVRAISVGVAAVALYWFVTRVLEVLGG